MMESRTAAVFGSTGLIGNLLLEELAESGKYSHVRSFVRQSTGIRENRIEEIVSDLQDVSSIASWINTDDLFICLGTTIKKAGSVTNMEKIDRDLPYDIAAAAFRNGVRNVSVVSSLGASSRSSNFYLRIKGEMEEKIMGLGFENLSIVRPSMLLGERKEKRTGERVGKVVMKAFRPVLVGKLSKYRAIHAADVASAMISLNLGPGGTRIVESDELQRIADSCFKQ